MIMMMMAMIMMRNNDNDDVNEEEEEKNTNSQVGVDPLMRQRVWEHILQVALLGSMMVSMKIT